jgi:ATP-dependent RNA helicase DDX41
MPEKDGEDAKSAWKRKREARRQQREDEPAAAAKQPKEDAYQPFVSAAKRRRLEQAQLLARRRGVSLDVNDDDDDEGPQPAGGAGPNDDSDDAATEQQLGEQLPVAEQEPHAPISLLDQAAALQNSLTEQEREEMSRKEEENRILREASQVQTNALQAASEVASGKVYTKPMPSTWTVPRYILAQGEESWTQIRKQWHMEVEGNDIPPPMKRFKDMKFPSPILALLTSKNIQRPTPIQMQGLPVALAGRDMVGIAFTGSGKTLTFSLPLVMASLEEELRLPLQSGEGPIGFILAPSRELARQTSEVVQSYCEAISTAVGYPTIRSQLLIGGEDKKEQLRSHQQSGVHAIVATPGRFRDFLKTRTMNLNNCRYCCLDEADRMLDLGFDEEVGEIMNYFPHQRQTLLFSATFPKKFQDFARQTLVQPIVVNVGRAGAANLDVIQEVEYVKEEAKVVYLLHCLQKTAPPVVIFSERKQSVDDIHEYLLLKGVDAVSIHGDKGQDERNEAIKLFKDGKKDVLVANDIAAKGLDFNNIQHVINFDMPSEIENYVHRIGRTGRCGKTGVATTFINRACDETTLLDLKHLLREARQRIPPVLMMLEDPRENNPGGGGCSFCGGLGHTIVDCPKIDKDARRVAGGHKDALTGGDW